jgi:hypothetical protein
MADENGHIRDLIAATDREIERRREIAKASAEEQERERRRFPPPWHVHELIECFIVKDSAGQPLAYVYFEDEAGRRTAANLLPYGEARRIAGHIASLPNLLRRDG